MGFNQFLRSNTLSGREVRPRSFSTFRLWANTLRAKARGQLGRKFTQPAQTRRKKSHQIRESIARISHSFPSDLSSCTHPKPGERRKDPTRTLLPTCTHNIFDLSFSSPCRRARVRAYGFGVFDSAIPSLRSFGGQILTSTSQRYARNELRRATRRRRPFLYCMF
jgi:hypothetical protein